MKIMKRSISIIILALIIIIQVLPVYAGVSLEDELGSLENYKPSTTTLSASFKTKLGVVFGYINIIGVVLSVVILTAMGIKYMLASVEEKAEYKKSMVPYLWGTLILFSGSFLPQFIYGLVEQSGLLNGNL